MKRLASIAAAAFLIETALADPVAVTSSPVGSFEVVGLSDTFGALSWRGGLVLESGDADFGGLSGMALGGDCEDLLAVSDAGRWFRAKLGYDDRGRLASLADGELAPIRDDKGKPLGDKPKADAEALAAVGKGRFLVGFERRERVGVYDIGREGLDARFRLVKSPKAISEGPTNGELEAVGRVSTGRYRDHYIAISERQRDSDGNTLGWLWKGSRTIPFAIANNGEFEITDLAILPDGHVLILERKFTRTSLPGMAIRRFDPDAVRPGAVMKPDPVLEASLPLYRIDNMEGIAVCKRGSETRVTLVSDNNFNTRLQSTLLLQFAYEP